MAASDLLNAASKAVIVVPILAPIISGKAFVSLTLPEATKGTINEVVIELKAEPLHNQSSPSKRLVRITEYKGS